MDAFCNKESDRWSLWWQCNVKIQGFSLAQDFPIRCAAANHQCTQMQWPPFCKVSRQHPESAWNCGGRQESHPCKNLSLGEHFHGICSCHHEERPQAATCRHQVCAQDPQWGAAACAQRNFTVKSGSVGGRPNHVGEGHHWGWNLVVLLWTRVKAEQFPMVATQSTTPTQKQSDQDHAQDNDDHLSRPQRTDSCWIHAQRNHHQWGGVQESFGQAQRAHLPQKTRTLEVWIPDPPRQHPPPYSLCNSHQDDGNRDHPPYSPDLAPCDFFLFPTLKKHLRSRRFGSVQLLQAEAIHVLSSIIEEKEFSKSIMIDLPDHWNHCALNSGQYFEGVKNLRTPAGTPQDPDSDSSEGSMSDVYWLTFKEFWDSHKQIGFCMDFDELTILRTC